MARRIARTLEAAYWALLALQIALPAFFAAYALFVAMVDPQSLGDRTSVVLTIVAFLVAYIVVLAFWIASLAIRERHRDGARAEREAAEDWRAMTGLSGDARLLIGEAEVRLRKVNQQIFELQRDGWRDMRATLETSQTIEIRFLQTFRDEFQQRISNIIGRFEQYAISPHQNFIELFNEQPKTVREAHLLVLHLYPLVQTLDVKRNGLPAPAE